MNNNLSGLPKIYYINMDKSTDREESMQEQFKNLNIVNYERISGSDPAKQNYEEFISSGHPELNQNQIACSHSHFRAIKKFYEDGGELALILEDDVNLEISNFWNFSWKEFESSLPKNFKIVQLTNNGVVFFYLKSRDFSNFGTTAYLITREYAKHILDVFFVNDRLDLARYIEHKVIEVVGAFITMPTAEELIYSSATNDAYSIPVFNWKNFGYSEVNSNLENHDVNRNSINTYWMSYHKEMTLEDLIGSKYYK